MLNLLIISNNPKSRLIQKFIQPLIKAKVDLVADFDHGLKDVFEKRPSTVIIQEQIAGVAGESVARHIQLLLGNGAPTFIMMHEGNPKIRPVKGLFDVIVDIDQPDETLVEEMLSALKCVIGDEWDKVAVPLPKSSPVRVVSATVPDEERVAADKLVDDFFLDMESSEKSSPGHGTGNTDDDAELQVASTSDELAFLLIQASQNTEPLKSLDAVLEPAIQSKKRPGGAKRPLKEKPQKAAKEQSGPVSAVTGESAVEPAVAEKAAEKETLDFPSLDAVTPPVPNIPLRSAETTAAPDPAAAATAPRSAAETTVTPPSPADFRISGLPAAYNEQLPEDILLAFNENYRSRSRLWVLVAIVLVVMGAAVAGWYLLDTKSHSVLFWRTATTTPPAGTQGSLTPVAVKQAAPDQSIQQAVTSAARRAAPPLPSFVPIKGLDSGFSARKPGWERYVDATREIRIYRAAGRIKAIQVVAAKGRVIADSFMQSALHEVTGRSEYTLSSQEQKKGIVIQRCIAAGGSDLLVYRKQPSGTISAFVVSLK